MITDYTITNYEGLRSQLSETDEHTYEKLCAAICEYVEAANPNQVIKKFELVNLIDELRARLGKLKREQKVRADVMAALSSIKHASKYNYALHEFHLKQLLISAERLKAAAPQQKQQNFFQDFFLGKESLFAEYKHLIDAIRLLIYPYPVNSADKSIQKMSAAELFEVIKQKLTIFNNLKDKDESLTIAKLTAHLRALNLELKQQLAQGLRQSWRQVLLGRTSINKRLYSSREVEVGNIEQPISIERVLMYATPKAKDTAVALGSTFASAHHSSVFTKDIGLDAGANSLGTGVTVANFGHLPAFESKKEVAKSINIVAEETLDVINGYVSAGKLFVEMADVFHIVGKRVGIKLQSGKIGRASCVFTKQFPREDGQIDVVTGGVGDCMAFAYIPSSGRVIQLSNPRQYKREMGYHPMSVTEDLSGGMLQRSLHRLPDGAILFRLTDGAWEALATATSPVEYDIQASRPYVETIIDTIKISKALKAFTQNNPKATAVDYCTYMRNYVVSQTEMNRQFLLNFIEELKQYLADYKGTEAYLELMNNTVSRKPTVKDFIVYAHQGNFVADLERYFKLCNFVTEETAKQPLSTLEDMLKAELKVGDDTMICVDEVRCHEPLVKILSKMTITSSQRNFRPSDLKETEWKLLARCKKMAVTNIKNSRVNSREAANSEETTKTLIRLLDLKSLLKESINADRSFVENSAQKIVHDNPESVFNHGMVLLAQSEIDNDAELAKQAFEYFLQASKKYHALSHAAMFHMLANKDLRLTGQAEDIAAWEKLGFSENNIRYILLSKALAAYGTAVNAGLRPEQSDLALLDQDLITYITTLRGEISEQAKQNGIFSFASYYGQSYDSLIAEALLFHGHNPELARKFAYNAAQQNDPIGWLLLAFIARSQDEVELHENIISHILESDDGSALYAFVLAKLYSYEDSYIDYAKAKQFYCRAMTAGYPPAFYEYAKHLLNSVAPDIFQGKHTSDRQMYRQCIDYLSYAVASGYPLAAQLLAKLRIQGRGESTDPFAEVLTAEAAKIHLQQTKIAQLEDGLAQLRQAECLYDVHWDVQSTIEQLEKLRKEHGAVRKKVGSPRHSVHNLLGLFSSIFAGNSSESTSEWETSTSLDESAVPRGTVSQASSSQAQGRQADSSEIYLIPFCESNRSVSRFDTTEQQDNALRELEVYLQSLYLRVKQKRFNAFDSNPDEPIFHFDFRYPRGSDDMALAGKYLDKVALRDVLASVSPVERKILATRLRHLFNNIKLTISKLNKNKQESFKHGLLYLAVAHKMPSMQHDFAAHELVAMQYCAQILNIALYQPVLLLNLPSADEYIAHQIDSLAKNIGKNSKQYKAQAKIYHEEYEGDLLISIYKIAAGFKVHMVTLMTKCPNLISAFITYSAVCEFGGKFDQEGGLINAFAAKYNPQSIEPIVNLHIHVERILAQGFDLKDVIQQSSASAPNLIGILNDYVCENTSMAKLAGCGI